MSDVNCTAAEALRLYQTLHDWKYRALDELRKALAAVLHSMDVIPDSNCTQDVLASLGPQSIERYHDDYQFHVRVDALAASVMRWVGEQNLKRVEPHLEERFRLDSRFLGVLRTDEGEIEISRRSGKEQLLDVIDYLLKERSRGRT